MSEPGEVDGVPRWLRSLLTAMHEEIRAAVRDDLRTKSKELLSGEARQEVEDTILQIDIRPEHIVTETFSRVPEPVVVICEGLERTVFPAGASLADAAWWVIIDPLDGSREISYDKRSAWVLSGVAPASRAPTLADIVWAIQTEVPVTSQPTGVMLTAGRTGPAVVRSCDLLTGEMSGTARKLQSSSAKTVSGGYAVFADYFDGSHTVTAEIADLVLNDVLQPAQPGKALAFNDQYLSSAGCMYLLASGTYRFYADLRPVTGQVAAARSGRDVGLCAHPYDLCTYLIAEKAGVRIADLSGARLSYPLATNVDCAWVGYANDSIRKQMEAKLVKAVSTTVHAGALTASS